MRREGLEYFQRKDIRTIRLRPRKTTRYKYRLLGVLAGIPAGFVVGYAGGVLACGGESANSSIRCRNSSAVTTVAFIAALIAAPYWFYKLGAWADRRTVLIVLDEQAERPSAKGEQP